LTRDAPATPELDGVYLQALRLRALIACGEFDGYRAFRLRQEHHRIHQARYRDSLTIAA